MTQRDTFDGAAEDYAAARPPYPATLYESLETLDALRPGARVLEVGCGAGQATADLARRCAGLVAVDPGANLVAQARARTAGLPVDFVVGRYEDFEAPAGAFDLVASAQAWHWIPAEIAFPRAASLLRGGGWLAVWGHVWPTPHGPAAAALKPLYDAVLPGAWDRPHPSSAYLPSGPLPGLFAASGLFGPAIHRGFVVDVTMSPERFGRLLRTDSNYHILPEVDRFAFFDRVTAALGRTAGDYNARWQTHLYVARRR